MKLSSFLAALVVLAASENAHTRAEKPESNSIVKKIVFKEDFADSGQILHIKKIHARIFLNPDFTEGQVEVRFYKQGKQLRFALRSALLNVDPNVQDKDIVNVCVQTLDLDRVPLTNAKPQHSRLLIKLGVSDAVTTSEKDVPKKTFDFSRIVGSGAFGAESRSGEIVPIFYWLATNTNKLVGASSIDKLVERNPDADIAVVLLRVATEQTN